MVTCSKSRIYHTPEQIKRLHSAVGLLRVAVDALTALELDLCHKHKLPIDILWSVEPGWDSFAAMRADFWDFEKWVFAEETCEKVDPVPAGN